MRFSPKLAAPPADPQGPAGATGSELKDTRRTERTWRRGTRRHDNVSLYVHTAIL
jgi:hypothetical protein